MLVTLMVIDNHDGVITLLEPDILECEVKWALGSITMNKPSGAECCTQYVIKFGTLSSGHKTGKGQFLFQSERIAMPKNVQTTEHVLISYARNIMLKILQAMF